MRTGNYWRKREKDLMKKYGLSPNPGSGSTWIQPEDGESTHILCQLKSSDGVSISIRKVDVKSLFHNARIAHKTPVFMLDFVGEFTLVCMRPEDVDMWAKHINMVGIREADDDGDDS